MNDMSEHTAALARQQQKQQREKQGSDKPKLNAQERAALRTMRREAKQIGAVLANNGEGGLPPSLVLGVMRRDQFTCKRCGLKGEGDCGGIGVHHKGGLDNPQSLWLKKKGHSNDPNNIVTVCAKCHDSIHEEDRAHAE